MKLRIKGTPFWGEVISDNGEFTQLEMKDGTVQTVSSKELTDKTITEVAEDFTWSVFAENGSRKNQAIFFVGIILTGILIGIMIK